MDIPTAPRPIDDMWRELSEVVSAVGNRWIRELLTALMQAHQERLRNWPAAQVVHHAYRGGLLEHVLKVAQVGRAVASAYGADADLVVAGALLHDIGKLEELEYDSATSYTRAGNLLGHITLGIGMVREAAARIEGFPHGLRVRIEHLIASHHGSRQHGSPVEPMTPEAFILSAVDDLDATLHQVYRHLAEDECEGEFTSYHPRLRRVLFKPSGR